MAEDHSHGAAQPMRWLRSGSNQLQSLHRRARLLRQLTGRLQEQLPPQLAGYWQVARLDTAELVVVVEGAARATQLRYLGKRLLQKAEEITAVRPARLVVRVASETYQQPKQKPQLSDEAARSLREAASVCGDPRLRQSLLRLARRAEGEE